VPMRQESEVLLISSEDLKSFSDQDNRDSSYKDPRVTGNLSIKRTSSQPPEEADVTVSDVPDSNVVNGDHEMAIQQPAEPEKII
jgi:hypothetical protein